MMSFGKHESREWALDESGRASRSCKRAVEGGVIFFDTADVYNGGQSEVVTGTAAAQALRHARGVRRRDEGERPDDARRERPRALAEAHASRRSTRSLERLGLDYVDLYQIHRWDDSTPIEETMEALHDVVKAGKARYIGASSMYAWQFAKAQRVAATPFVSMQNHYNLIYREEEREMIPQCLDQGDRHPPVEPARARPARPQRHRHGRAGDDARRDRSVRDSLYRPDLDVPVIDRLGEVAAEAGVSPAQIALAWLLHKPGVTAPIVGATKLEHLEDALAAEELSLTEDEIAQLEEPYVPHPVSGIDL